MALPEFDRDYLDSKGIVYEEKNQGGINGLIIRNWPLPAGKFNVSSADLLILIPSGYPDVHPDMWYFHPPVLLNPNGAYPRQTQAVFHFDGIAWQRWSRHLNPGEWRGSVDGIHTFLKKVITAVEIAT